MLISLLLLTITINVVIKIFRALGGLDDDNGTDKTGNDNNNDNISI